MLKTLLVIAFLIVPSLAINITLISHSICRIIEEFYTKYSRNVDIIDYDGTQSDLVDKVMKNLNESMTVTLQTLNRPKRLKNPIEYQSIILFDNFQSLNDFNNADFIKIPYINPLRILVYCVNSTEKQLASLETKLMIPSYYYFIVVRPSDSSIKLFTFENQNDLKICNENQRLVQINEFSAPKLEWTLKPVMPKKYTNFYGCIMVIGAHQTINFEFISIEDIENSSLQKGLGISIMEMISTHLNFLVHFIPCSDSFCRDNNYYNTTLYNVLMTSSIDVMALNMGDDIKFRQVMINVQSIPLLLVSPGDLYTSYEKMILPFDYETWIGLVTVFISGISIVLLLTLLPQNIKSLIFGRTVRTPCLNFFLAFFGEAQTTSPDGFSSRLIWIFFIFYCLVIRTSYQGKLFEFTSTAVRKPQHPNLESLKENGFTLYMMDINFTDPTIDYVNESIQLPMQFLPVHEYQSIFHNNISDPSFKGVFLTSDIDHAVEIYLTRKPTPKRYVHTPIVISYCSFGFLYVNLWNERLLEIIGDLISGGLINYHLELITKSMWNMIPVDSGTDKIVLNLSHLGFGFQICFYAAYIAFLVFLIEIFWFWARIYCKSGWIGVVKLATSTNSEKSVRSSAVDTISLADSEASNILSESRPTTTLSVKIKSLLEIEDCMSDNSTIPEISDDLDVVFGAKLDQTFEQMQVSKFEVMDEFNDLIDLDNESWIL